MTNKEALAATLQTSVPDLSLEKALADRDIDSADDYESANLELIDRSAIDLLWGLLSAPDISEGGYSIRYDRNTVKSRLLFLAGKYNVTDIIEKLQPSVSGARPW